MATRALRTAWLLALAACAGPARPAARTIEPAPRGDLGGGEAPVRRAGPAPASSDGRASSPPACRDDASTPPMLDDYTMTRDGERYRVDVRFAPATAEWLPTVQPSMPLHYASRLAFVNLAEHPEVDALRGRTLRFSFVLESRDVRKVEGVHEWRAEYRARIASICVRP